MNKINIKDWELLIYFPKINKENDLFEFPKELLDRFECANEDLKQTLSFWIGDTSKSNLELNKNKIMENISESFEKSNEILSGKGKISVIVLPTFDEFIVDSLGGSCGYVAYNDTIWLYINPNASSQSIQETICHEYHHIKRREIYTEEELNEKITLKECFVTEGLAEHFKEKILGIKQASYTNVLSEEEIKELLKNLKNKLDSRDSSLIDGILFGNDQYKNSTGYTIGYYLVKNFLESNLDLNWEELTKLPADEFINNYFN
jgi:uncharacterized protein YjaZ